MRLAGYILMMLAATIMADILLLYAPLVLTLTLRPTPKSESLQTFNSISADDPDPPRVLSPEAAKTLRRVIHPSCRRTMRSESDARKLNFSSSRVTKFCDCSIDIMIESAPDGYRKEGFEDFNLLTSEMHASKRRELDDASYLAKVTDLERACAAREQANTPTRR